MTETNKGTAMVVVLVYIMIVAILCSSVLAFSSQHYKLISQRVDKFQNYYLAKGGLLGAVLGGLGGTFNVDPADTTTGVTVSTTNIGGTVYIQCERDY